jgi:hypothetical protein
MSFMLPSYLRLLVFALHVCLVLFVDVVYVVFNLDVRRVMVLMLILLVSG